MLEKGLVQIYTGDGKGKTTAAFGLALRAIGQGNKVLIYQFLKPSSLEIGERFALQISGLKIRVEALDVQWNMAKRSPVSGRSPRRGSPMGAKSPNDPKAVAAAQIAIHDVLERLAETAAKRFYDVLILDEIVYCLSKGLAKLADIKNLVEKRDSRVEIVLTGWGATQELIDMADLVTEMKNIKHPFDKGIPARCGIEF